MASAHFPKVFHAIFVTTALLACGSSEGVLPGLSQDGSTSGDAGNAMPDAAVVPEACDASGKSSVRIVAGNLTSGNDQSYNAGPGGRIFKALAPDVALLQEFNVGENTDAELSGFVQRYFGPSYRYARGSGGDSGGGIPNGVVSRWPIVESGFWVDPEVANRTHAWAKVLLPGGKTLLAISVHLKAGSSSSTRAKEAQALLQNLSETSADYTVLGGDFNTDSRTEPVVNTLTGVFATESPYPADHKGNQNTSSNRSKPYDWVLPVPALRAFEQPATLAGQSFANGLVFDTRVFTGMATLAASGGADAVLESDSAAPNMQHMAVLRTFSIPCK